MVNADGGRVFASTTQTPQQEASLTIDARNNRPGSPHQAFDTHRIFALPVESLEIHLQTFHFLVLQTC